MAKRAFVHTQLINNRVAIANNAPLKYGPYYSISAIWMTYDEFNNSARSIGDFIRAGDGNGPVTDLLRLLTRALPQDESSRNVQCFFIRVPPIGVCILICTATIEFFSSWSHRLYNIVTGKIPTGSKAAMAAGKSVPVITSPSSLTSAINATFHPRLRTTPIILRNVSSSFQDICDASVQIAAVHTGAANNPANHANPDNAADANNFSLSAGIVQNVPECSLLNPFVAMSIHRVMTFENLAIFSDTLSCISSNTADSIFSDTGYIVFSRLPNHMHAFPAQIADFIPECTFPGALPPASVIVQGYTSLRLHAAALAASTMPTNELHNAILHNDIIPGAHPPDNTFINIVNGLYRVYDEAPNGTANMQYMQSAHEAIHRIRTTPGATAQQIKDVFVENVAACIGLMADRVNDTPRSINVAATLVLEGLATHGVHFIPPEQRPTLTSAWVAFTTNEHQASGVTRHHQSICSRLEAATLTCFLTNHGGIHTLFTGLPADGKSYTIGHIMGRIMPYMTVMLSASKEAFTASTAANEKVGVLFIDEASRESVNQDVLKTITSNRFAPIKRLRNSDHAKQDTGTGEIPTMSVCLASNFSASVVFSGSTIDPAAMQRAQRGRPRSSQPGVAVDLTAQRDASDQVAGALRSRFLCFTLKTPPIPIEEMMQITNNASSRASESDATSRLRYMFNLAVIICTFIRANIIPVPESYERCDIVSTLGTYFKAHHPNIRAFDNRSADHFNTSGTVCAILEQIYERIFQGGAPLHDACTLTVLAELIYDIAVSLVPTRENILYGNAMVFDSNINNNSDDDFATDLLYALRGDSIPTSAKAHTILTSELSALSQRLHTTAETLASKLNALTASRVVLYAFTVPEGSTVSELAPFTITPAKYEADLNVWHLDCRYLRTGVSVANHFDRVLIGIVVNCSFSGEDLVGTIDPDGDCPVINMPCIELVTRVRAALIADPSSHGQSPESVAAHIADAIRHRINMGFLIPRTTAQGLATTWHAKITNRYVLAPDTSETWQTRSFDVDAAYIHRVRESAATDSIVVRAFKTVIHTSTPVPLLIPGKRDPRLPEVVVVQDPLPMHKFSYSPDEYSYTDHTDKRPAYVFCSDTGPSLRDPYSVSVSDRAIRCFKIAPLATSPAAAVAVADAHRLDVFVARHNVVPGGIAVPFDQFTLARRAPLPVVSTMEEYHDFIFSHFVPPPAVPNAGLPPPGVIPHPATPDAPFADHHLLPHLPMQNPDVSDDEELLHPQLNFQPPPPPPHPHPLHPHPLHPLHPPAPDDAYLASSDDDAP